MNLAGWTATESIDLRLLSGVFRKLDPLAQDAEDNGDYFPYPGSVEEQEQKNKTKFGRANSPRISQPMETEGRMIEGDEEGIKETAENP
jgi:hypothetical protein